MSDRVFFSVAGLAVVAMLALALVWPQGLGARSPGPFGRAPASAPRLRPTLTAAPTPKQP